MSDSSYWPHHSDMRGDRALRELPSPPQAHSVAQEDFIDWQKWRDPNAPVQENAPWLQYPGSDPPTAEDLRKALFIPPFSPPPEHWRALIPLDLIPDKDGSYTHPINQLPVELLSYIFTRCLDLEASNLAHAEVDSNFISLLISRVCRRWRLIALDTPFLWQHFLMAPCKNRSHYAIARLFLKRTKGMGMHIRYAENTLRGARTGSCPRACALDFIIRNISQIVALELEGPRGSTVMRLTAVRRGSISMMKRFVLRTRSPNMDPSLARGLHLIFLSNGLREIKWNLATFVPEEISWTRLHYLSLSHCPIEQHTLLRILLSAPALQEAHVEVAKALGPAKRFTAVHADALHSLTVEGEGPQDQLLEALHLPGLRVFSLRPLSSLSHEASSNSPGWPFLDASVLYGFLSRVQGSLERFYLLYGGKTFDEAALVHLITTPQFSEIQILHAIDVYGNVGDLFFSQLCQGNGSVPALPHLSRLSLTDCVTTDGIISRALDARHNAGYPIRDVILGYPTGYRRPHRKDRATFAKLIQANWYILWEEGL
ncbi:uncharacterized protein SCHCODRAFT_02570266 [Schizophyllum commune H4-8]|uniref:uncharacterized protein n=1 Tax=Schizophyllum commune (strain H4-8 / FGSC 9210) TaxID=578458 RepID=UPI00215FCCB3|nr:uncharacterized protein SCHCODRAFT_02570266 [Schizophyllum commune H4-8]KAI5896971.1 hypothetical protein SCHCODRAFT_02570266 [Schizophyllum commune H4-8]